MNRFKRRHPNKSYPLKEILEPFLWLQLRHEPVHVVNHFKSENNYFFKIFRNFLLFYDIKRFITGGYGLLRRTGLCRNGSYLKMKEIKGPFD